MRDATALLRTRRQRQRDAGADEAPQAEESSGRHQQAGQGKTFSHDLHLISQGESRLPSLCPPKSHSVEDEGCPVLLLRVFVCSTVKPMIAGSMPLLLKKSWY